MASLYLHIPYCEKKCVDCDFYSIENMNSMDLFLKSLEKEIAMTAGQYSHRETFETIFFGGEHPPSFRRRRWKGSSTHFMRISE